MKILHTSDWHLGHRLHEQSQMEEQSLFLDWLINYIEANEIDVLLISGDIFDVGVPPSQAQKLYYDFLIRLHNSTCSEVIITGGNHDAPSTLNAPRELLNALNIRLVGKATDSIDDEIFRISIDNEDIIVAAVPYLRDQDIRRAIASESFEEINNRYKTALTNHFSEIGARCNLLKTQQTKVIAMGHLFAIGGKTSDSEQSIYVGNLGDIGAADFPEVFDYVALGHLHRSQLVGGNGHIRYSGSPYILSFSEVGQDKKIIEISTDKTLEIKEIIVPMFRKIVQIQGSVESCKLQMERLHSEDLSLIPWVEVILTNQNEAATGYKEIYTFARDLKMEVLKVTVKDNRQYEDYIHKLENIQHLNSFTPLDVFKLKCEEQAVDLTENEELLDAFNEILQVVTEND